MSVGAFNLAVVVGMASEAKIVAPLRSAVIGGGVTAQVENGLAALHRARRLDAILSFGIAGGLDPALKTGALLVASRLASAGTTYPCDGALAERLRQKLPAARDGALYGADRAIVEVAEKAALFSRSGAVAVDMESLGAARFAARHAIPFAALRAISDPATRAIPSCALAGFRPDGSADAAAVVWALLKQPGQLPDLIATARDAGAALRQLSLAWSGVSDLF